MQLEYPNGFDIPTFPAGKRIVATRVLGVATMVVFLAIIFVCGMLLWVQKSVTVHPFLVSVDNLTGQWTIVGHQHEDIKQVSATRTLQESVIAKFMEHWYNVATAEENSILWQPCKRDTECDFKSKLDANSRRCALYCISGDEIFTRFIKNVTPVYQISVIAGEKLSLDINSLQTVPVGEISDSGGMWKVRAQVRSSIVKPITILAYVLVKRDTATHPKTMGYYVDNFNAYKIN